jgi:hypothetical protein
MNVGKSGARKKEFLFSWTDPMPCLPSKSIFLYALCSMLPASEIGGHITNFPWDELLLTQCVKKARKHYFLNSCFRLFVPECQISTENVHLAPQKVHSYWGNFLTVPQ